jgi:hypothetical protein
MSKPPPKEAPLAGSLPPPPADAVAVKGTGRAKTTSRPEAQTVFASSSLAATIAPPSKKKTKEEELAHARTLSPDEIDPLGATMPPEPRRKK